MKIGRPAVGEGKKVGTTYRNIPIQSTTAIARTRVGNKSSSVRGSKHLRAALVRSGVEIHRDRAQPESSLGSVHAVQMRHWRIRIAVRIIDPPLKRCTGPSTGAPSQVHGGRELPFCDSSIHGRATQCSDANHVRHAKECRRTAGLRNEFMTVDMMFELHDKSFMEIVLSSRGSWRSSASPEEPEWEWNQRPPVAEQHCHARG
jgi:hypothetical protein